MQTAAEVHDVSRLFGGFAALRHVSCQFPAGGMHLLLGENGAGKSTLLRLLAGLAEPTSGQVQVLGAPPRERLARIAYMSHAPMLYDELTAMENLRYFGQLQRPCGGMGCAGSPEMALRAVGLDPALPRPLAAYSQGMRQRVSLARVLLADPELVLLDEPFSNMDVAGAADLVTLLLVILTTHQAELVRRHASSVIELSHGRLLEAVAA